MDKDKKTEHVIKKGEIWLADFFNSKKELTKKPKKAIPVLVISDNNSNTFSPLITVVPLLNKKNSLAQVRIVLKGCGLKKKTLVLVDRTTPLDKSLLIEKLGVCSESQLRRIEDGIALYNGMMPKYSKLCLQDLINAYKTAHIFLSNQIATDKYKQSQENLIKSYCESYDINFDNVFKQMIYEK